MKRYAVCWIVVALFVTLVGCTGIPVETEPRTMTVRFHRPDWSRADIVYRTEAVQAPLVRRGMAQGARGWWSVQVEADRLEFAFEGDGKRVDLGGTQGCYSESHHACAGPWNPAENFRGSAQQLWVRDGLVYPFDPDRSHPPGTLTVMSLNLHSYQEFHTPGTDETKLSRAQVVARVAQHGHLFDRVASAIDTLQPDVVCLQEVAQWGGGNTAFGADDTNMVRQIQQRLRTRYQAAMDWSHRAWDAWLEGSAVLSRHPVEAIESRYISDAARGTTTFWKSRNVPRMRTRVPGVGSIDVFSVHTGWWNDREEPFQAQFERLTAWAAQVRGEQDTTLLCGDFNQVAGSREAQFMTNGTGYTEQYGLINPDGLLDPTIGGAIDGWTGTSGKRIDLLLLNDDSPLQIQQAQRIFTQNVFGRVSDHTGIYAHFRMPSTHPNAVPDRGALYLTGSFAGNRVAPGLRLQALGGERFRLLTWLGAAQSVPAQGLLPHRLGIVDGSGKLLWGGFEAGSGALQLRRPTALRLGGAPLRLSLTRPTLLQFDLDLRARTLTVSAAVAREPSVRGPGLGHPDAAASH